jgi:hypothetical protein
MLGIEHFSIFFTRARSCGKRRRSLRKNVQQTTLNNQREGEMLNPQHSTINAQHIQIARPASPVFLFSSMLIAH